jgi:hypothetical protein
MDALLHKGSLNVRAVVLLVNIVAENSINFMKRYTAIK